MAGGILGGVIGAILPGVLPSITDTARILVDRLVPDPAQKAQAQRELEAVLTGRETALQTTIQQQNEQQNALNLAEAQGNDRYSSRWRPTCGWICAFGLGYQFLVAPLLTWVTGIVGVIVGAAIPPAPTLAMDALMTLLFGLLGLGAQRTVERTLGVPGAMPGGVKR